jgi:hypothetical protein
LRIVELKGQKILNSFIGLICLIGSIGWSARTAVCFIGSIILINDGQSQTAHDPEKLQLLPFMVENDSSWLQEDASWRRATIHGRPTSF